MEKQNKNQVKVLDYSTSPGPRYCNQGDDSGEDFYHKVLNHAFSEAYRSNATLTVDLDGPDGYASSFLDEAFGNLVYDFGKDTVLNFLEIKSEEEPEWIEMIEKSTYVSWEKRRAEGKKPKVTRAHPAWTRLINGKMEENVWINLSSGK